MDKKEIKQEIKYRESIIRRAEEELLRLQQRLENNKKWVAGLKEQLKICGR